MSKANEAQVGGARVKRGMAEMLKGGVIMDVVNVEQAKIAEDAGAVAVMALERVPADIRAQGGVSRMSDPDMIEKIQAAGADLIGGSSAAFEARMKKDAIRLTDVIRQAGTKAD